MFANTWKNFIKNMYENMWSVEIEQSKTQEQATINDLNNQITNLKATITNWQNAQPSMTFPALIGTIQLPECYAKLKEICDDVHISDNFFNLTSVDEASKFSEATHVQYVQWIAEDHDCDNFSFALMGYWSDGLKSYAFGIAWSASHAFNIMIDQNKVIWIVEPQTNKYYSLEEVKTNQQYWPLKLIVM